MPSAKKSSTPSNVVHLDAFRKATRASGDEAVSEAVAARIEANVVAALSRARRDAYVTDAQITTPSDRAAMLAEVFDLISDVPTSALPAVTALCRHYQIAAH